MAKQSHRWDCPDVRTLTEEPRVGRYYQVPTIFWHEHGFNVPVLGHRHNDPEIFKTAQEKKAMHWHIDLRFLSDADIEKYFGWQQGFHTVTRDERLSALMGRLVWDNGSSAETVLRRRRCSRPMPLFPVGYFSPVDKKWKEVPVTRTVERTCEGRRVDPQNPLCPHKGFSLRGLPVDSEGCVICPGHGLKINLTTGEIVTRYGDENGGTA